MDRLRQMDSNGIFDIDSEEPDELAKQSGKKRKSCGDDTDITQGEDTCFDLGLDDKPTTSIQSLVDSPLVGYFKNNDTNEIILRCPVGVINYRQGIHACLLTGKQSVSSFKCVGYCEETDTSLIECGLFTGRTHQLRLHLEFLGNPIANDPCYGGVLFYDQPDLMDKANIILRDMRQRGYHLLSKPPHLGHSIDGDEESPLPSVSDQSISPASSMQQNTNESDEEYLIRTCRYCCDKSSLEMESVLHCNGIWLHALRYERPGHWRFETAWPKWASHFLK